MERKEGEFETHHESLPEFDQYALSYSEILDDPLRNRFARDPLHFHRRKWIVLERLLEAESVVPGKLRWLDVGCGQGELLELAGKNFAEAVGCDPSARMLPSGATFKTFQQPSQVELPFEDHSVDLVTAVCVYHHVHRGDRTLLTNEIRRILRPNGLFCVIEHNPWNPVTRTIVKRCALDVDAELLAAHETAALLRSSGFVPLRREYFLYLPEGLFSRFGRIERIFSGIPLGGQYALLARAPK